MATTTLFSMLNCVAVLDGVTVRGFYDGDDAVAITFRNDVGGMIVGADGYALFSQIPDRSVTISLKLMHTSPTHTQLHRIYKTFLGGVRSGFPFTVNDAISNEGGSTDAAFIMTMPVDQKGKNPAVREWVLVAGIWEPNDPTTLYTA